MNENFSTETLNSAINAGGYNTSVCKAPSYKRLWWSLGVASAITTAWIIAAIVSTGEVGFAFLTGLFVFAFSSSLFFEDSATRNVMFFMTSRSIRFPGLIWEFSFDGFMWLIGMKLLFAAIGFLFGVLCAIIGVIVSIIISPFALPFDIRGFIRDQKEGI